jgi:hypothetical protein
MDYVILIPYKLTQKRFRDILLLTVLGKEPLSENFGGFDD